MSAAPKAMVDVAIVGGGPVGVTLAHLLGQQGLSVAIFEREAAVFPLPRAIHVDGEVMRVFETIGLRDELAAISRPGLKGMAFVNAEGRTLLLRGGSTAQGPHGCANNHYVHQPDLEAVLRLALTRHDGVRLHLGHEVGEVEVLPGGGAALTVTRLADGAVLRTQARWVVGCDGGRSAMRRRIGTTMVDLGLHQPWLVVDARLGPGAPALPEHTVQWCDPARPMTYCNVTGDRRRWEIMLLPGDDPVAMTRPEVIWPLLARWLRPGDAVLERAAVYTFHSVVARGWRRGPLLLAGDAAHQTPPFLGQGLCAGIRDAANLAWKLAAVARGRADEAILDSVEAERGPHVQAFIELAVRLGGIIQTTDAQAAAERDARFTAGGAPEIFEVPQARLGPGVWLGESPAVGRVFPQPRLADGRRLDSAIGVRLAVLGTPAVLAGVSAATRRWWAFHDFAVQPVDGGAAAEALQALGAAAVLLRPDRYVAAVAQDAADLDAQVAALPCLRNPATVAA